MSKGVYPLSVIVITFNEERNIIACLESVSWAREIIVVDSFSADRTVELAKTFTDRVFQREWMGYAASKEFALGNVSNEWVFWIDADERVSGDLAKEIQDEISCPADKCAYEMGRRAHFIGRWIKHSGWYPGYVVRLFRRTAASFTLARVHEKVNIRGPIGRLRTSLDHFTDENLFHYFWKLNRYTSLAAEEVSESQRIIFVYHLIFKPLYMFIKMYFFQFGFLDGMHGLVLSLLSSGHVFIKYAKMWERKL